MILLEQRGIEITPGEEAPRASEPTGSGKGRIRRGQLTRRAIKPLGSCLPGSFGSRRALPPFGLPNCRVEGLIQTSTKLSLQELSSRAIISKTTTRQTCGFKIILKSDFSSSHQGGPSRTGLARRCRSQFVCLGRPRLIAMEQRSLTRSRSPTRPGARPSWAEQGHAGRRVAKH